MADLLYPFGSDRGGMAVTISGTDAAGDPAELTWSLVAGAGDGPYVPILPVLALIRRLLAHDRPPAGAAACVGVTDLAALETEFAALDIHTRTAWSGSGQGLYRRIMGQDFDNLPDAVRHLHDGSSRSYRGQADVSGKTGLLSRILRLIMGLPPNGSGVPVDVHIKVRGAEEIWRRDFAGIMFSSVIRQAPDDPALQEECFGPLQFGFDLLGRDGGLELRFRRWRCLGLPLPAFLAPEFTARESEYRQGRFRFDIQLHLPLIGHLIGYAGTLDVKAS